MPPPFNICSGENWTVDRLNAVMASRSWANTAIFIVWDDFGGWYDHVPPPRQYGCDTVTPYGLGFRLPMIIISPFARRASIYRTPSHQGSVVRFIETVFGLPSLQT